MESKNKEMKMMKYIVEGPVLEEGQNLGPGGVRKNGKMATLFKNAVPYEEPTSLVVDRTNHYDAGKEFKTQMARIAVDVSVDVALTLWNEIGRPLVIRGIDKLLCHIATKKKNTISDAKKSEKEGIVDAYYSEVSDTRPKSKSNNIIKFPNEKVV